MSLEAEPKHQINISVGDHPTVELAQRLMDDLDLDEAALFTRALETLDWCIKAAAEGRSIVSIDRSGDGSDARELPLPPLDFAWEPYHQVRHITLDDEAFDRVTHLVDERPTPTQALRDLMEEAYRDEE